MRTHTLPTKESPWNFNHEEARRTRLASRHQLKARAKVRTIFGAVLGAIALGATDKMSVKASARSLLNQARAVPDLPSFEDAMRDLL